MAIAKGAQVGVGNFLQFLCRWLAYLGGIVLMGMALVTVASVGGRALLSFGFTPITGDFELVEAGCAIAVFAFMPWCQLNRGHVSVDIVVDQMPPRLRAALGLVGDLTVAVVSGLILWRLYLGFAEKFPYGSDELRAALWMGSKPYFPETTYELELPIWLPFGLCLIGAALFFVVSLYTVWRALNWTISGQEEVTL